MRRVPGESTSMGIIGPRGKSYYHTVRTFQKAVFNSVAYSHYPAVSPNGASSYSRYDGFSADTYIRVSHGGFMWDITEDVLALLPRGEYIPKQDAHDAFTALMATNFPDFK